MTRDLFYSEAAGNAGFDPVRADMDFLTGARVCSVCVCVFVFVCFAKGPRSVRAGMDFLAGGRVIIVIVCVGVCFME